MNYGDLCPLPRLVELKHQYKVRIFMDESVSFGTLGKTGRGVTEHFNVPIDEVDLIAGSLENAIASVGGFCCGKAYVIDHQRLSGLGYCFSASAPPMLSQGAITALDILDSSPEMLVSLHEICEYAHTKFATLKGLVATGASISPIIHLSLASSASDRDADCKTLRSIVRLAEEQNIALTMAAYLAEEIKLPQPSLRIPISCELTREDIDHVIAVIQSVLDQVLL
jgi:serine palmitoyltransferase